MENLNTLKLLKKQKIEKYKKDKKEKQKKELAKFKKKIIQNKNDLPKTNIKYYNYKSTDSWFSIKEYSVVEKCNTIQYSKSVEDKELIKCQKIIMSLTEEQKKIINSWFDAYTKMYNATLKYIYENYNIKKCGTNRTELIEELKRINNDEDIETFYNFYNLRSILYDIKNKIIEDSKIESINRNTKINAHTLDYAIRLLCSNFKSIKTNILRGHMKRFRMKFWRNNRVSKTLEIEHQYIKNNKICHKILGDIKYFYNGSEVDLINIDSNVKINYNDETKEYSLLVPIKFNNKIIENKKENLISLDPGLRTFMTCVSETKVTEIGTNVNKIIGKDILNLAKIKSKNISKKKKKKKTKRLTKYISNKVDDLHWKSINYLVKNYNTVLLGDMSANSIVRNKTSILRPIQKTACLRTKYYQFRQRLEYKCLANKVNYALVNEKNTSQACSICGNIKTDLGASKIYKCIKCNSELNRDINGARNIYIKHLLV